jgi:UDP-N-acetylmuramyl pentapeptide phosphotransferase/UDP-N-acetylglucosamine-1-phosphate transferase
MRTNYRGRPVDLLAGPAAAAGAAAASLVTPAAAAPLLVATAAAGLGLYDDLAGAGHARGLRGHLAALRNGEVTTGLVKMVGLAAAGAASAVMSPRATAAPAPVDLLVDTALVSGAANLVNLLDLRPGRALKTVLVAAAPLALCGGRGGGVAAGVAATAGVLLPDDLAERRMVGDCGANALGALVGWAITAQASRPARYAALAGVVALTLVSEYVSFSALIEGNPALSAADRWGRLPA